MTATIAAPRPEAETDLRRWSIWAEGFAATGQSEGAWQLNEAPVLAASFDEAVALFAHRSPESHLFERRRDGTWTYWGCRLFDNASDARGAFG